MPKYSGLAGHQFGGIRWALPTLLSPPQIAESGVFFKRKQANKIEPKIGSFQLRGFRHSLSLDAILLLWKVVAAIERAEYFRGTQTLSLVSLP